jgi:hypothetical protein
MLPLLKGDTPLARSNGGDDLAKANKAMSWEGDSSRLDPNDLVLSEDVGCPWRAAWWLLVNIPARAGTPRVGPDHRGWGTLRGRLHAR